MKTLLAALALIAPLNAMAALCDSTELNKINELFNLIAPHCIASGDYTSDACAIVRQIPDDVVKAEANLKKSKCYGGTYDNAPRTAEYSELIFALPGHPSNTVKPVADDSYAENVCNALIPMYKTKDLGTVTNLVWMRLGDQPKSKPFLTCMYRAIIPNEKDGDIPVRVMVEYDKAKSSYTLKVE